EVIPLNQLIPVWDRYIALGDANCLLRLASLFEKRGKPYRIRGEAETTFYKDFQGLEIVRDREHPEKTDWKLINSWPYWNIDADYAIVSRVLDPRTDRVVVVAAGITHFGTAGAGDFLSQPQYFSEVVPRLPHDWPTKNLQIVLRIPVVQGTSGHPE